VPDFGRRRLVVIVLTVEVSYRRANELVDIDAFEAGNSDGVELAAKGRILSPPKRANTTASAKDMVDTVGLIVDEVGFAGRQSKGVRPNDDPPHPRFGTDWTVAFEGALAQIKIGFKTNSATVAASRVFVFHAMRLLLDAQDRFDQDAARNFFKESSSSHRNRRCALESQELVLIGNRSRLPTPGQRPGGPKAISYQVFCLGHRFSFVSKVSVLFP